MDHRSSSRETPAARRILVVDGHPLMRRGLAALIGHEPDLTVCATAATPRAALAAVAASRPDLVVIDLSLADGEGLALVRHIRSDHADLPVLVLSLHDAPFHAQRALRAGARGYIPKPELSETLLIAIRCLLRGETFLSPTMRSRLDAG